MQCERIMIDYELLINRIQKNLPTLPVIVNELTNALENPDNSTQQVEEVMVSDQAICMKILRVANTSFFSPRSIRKSNRCK